MNEELMFVIKKARMGFGKFHLQHTQNKAIINTKTKYRNHIILEKPLAAVLFIYVSK